MRESRTSGSMSRDGKRAPSLRGASVFDSTAIQAKKRCEGFEKAVNIG